MVYLLIQVLRKNNNSQIKELQILYRHSRLLIDPQEKMTIRIENKTKFYIDHIRQDLVNNEVILYHYIDICHRDFWKNDFWKEYIDKKYEEGWMNIPKSWKHLS